MVGFGEVEKVTITTEQLTTQNLAKISTYFFQQYADYSINEASNKVTLSSKPEKAKPRVEKITVQNQSASYDVIAGEKTYTILAAGLFDKWGRPTLYRTNSLNEMGAVLRLCSLEGHLSTTVMNSKGTFENIRFLFTRRRI